jgi:peptidoglycan/xylan/chitin deacetylase (PgdA/CDA1 family)
MKKELRTGLILGLLLSLILLSMLAFAAGQVNAENSVLLAQTWNATLGWDFEDHGNTHSKFSTLTEAQIRAQEEAVNNAFTDHGYSVPQHISYPYGDYSATVESVVSEYRQTGRMVWGEMMTFPVKNWYEMRSAQLKKATPWKKIKGWVDKCIQTNSLLHIFTHDVSARPSTYGCTPQMLTRLLDYLVQKQDEGKLKVMTMAEAYDSWSVATQGEATVVISFDDTNRSDSTVVYPLFKSRGLKGTSYITTSFVGLSGHLTWEDIAIMRSGQ